MFSYVFVLFLRIISGFLIFFSPIYSLILSTFFDLIDAEFAAKAGLTKNQYQYLDKAFDLFFYTLIVVYCYLEMSFYFPLFLFLYLYRLFGQILFYLTKKRYFLVLFANFFESLFVIFFLVEKTVLKNLFIGNNYLYLVIFVIIALKIFQEWFLHIADLSVRENILKLKKRPWRKI